jgi:hypothetical protein
MSVASEIEFPTGTSPRSTNRRSNASRAAVSASLDAISKADAAMSRWVIAAGLKLIVVPVDSTWMRRSLASGSRARASHASRASAGRSRQRQSKWAGSTRRCTRTALVTAPFGTTSSNVLVIRAVAPGRTIAYNEAKAHRLLSTLIEACASEGRGLVISNEEQIRCVTIVSTL